MRTGTGGSPGELQARAGDAQGGRRLPHRIFLLFYLSTELAGGSHPALRAQGAAEIFNHPLNLVTLLAFLGETQIIEKGSNGMSPAEAKQGYHTIFFF